MTPGKTAFENDSSCNLCVVYGVFHCIRRDLETVRNIIEYQLRWVP